MATSLTLENDSSLAQGYLKVNGSTAATLTTSGITGNLTGNVTGNLTGSLIAGGSLTLAAAQTASGTAVDFIGIPSWVKRITVMFNGVSTNGSSEILVRIGDSGGIENTGYVSGSARIAGLGATSYLTSSSGFLLFGGLGAELASGITSIFLLGSNTWVSNHTCDAVTFIVSGGGKKTLSGTLDRIRITTANGTDTFDAGTINIAYEG